MILKMHRAAIQAERHRKRDEDSARLSENWVELSKNNKQLTALRSRLEELEGSEYELNSRVTMLSYQMRDEDERFLLEKDRLRFKQKEAEETLEAHAQQTETLVRIAAFLV